MTSNLCFSTVNNPVLAVILASMESFKSLSLVSFDCVSSPTISPFNSRMSSTISSRVVIASQCSPICQSSKSRNVKSGSLNAKGNVQKTMLSPVIPSEMDTSIRIVEKNDRSTILERAIKMQETIKVPPIIYGL